MTITDKLSISNYAFNKYVKKIQKLIEQGRANEETFYSSFEYLLKNYFNAEEFEVRSVPKTETEDKPDFNVYMDNIPIISIEAKNPDDPIDNWLKADSGNRLFEQIYRYRGREEGDIPVMVTDFKSIWIIDKDKPNSLKTDHKVKYKFKIIDDSEAIWKTFTNATNKFCKALSYLTEDMIFSIEKVNSMITHLVKYAKILKKKVIEAFNEPENPMKKYLENIRRDFLESIFSKDKQKKSKEFADLFAQTLVYGGFVSWMRFCKEENDPKDFSFDIAIKYLPYDTFIYDIFANISIHLSPKVQKEIIKKIERIFQSTKFEKVTENTETLMITFYSKFLWKYDKEMAKDRGIVFTPHPIINFIVRGINYILKKSFNLENGILTDWIKFLDPAAGTMGFPCELLRLSKMKLNEKYSKQPNLVITKFDEWVHKQFLENTFAFEILMAPYTLGHLRTNMIIEELGGKFDSEKDRVNLFLFNTLMDAQLKIDDFKNEIIGNEILSAMNVRKNEKILVILSNPPYNVSSQNKYDWIEEKINYKDKSFKEKSEEEIIEIKKKFNDYFWDLQREGTKEISGYKAIQDDYVKFIRFAQWKVKKNGYGIVGFVTNNYYIDGLIFRGMRSSLRRDFDEIWIVDLHGDARKGVPYSVREKGVFLDENVFDIRVGVAIAFFIRKIEHSEENCIIKYVDKWGKKSEKFSFLDNKIEDLVFTEVPERLDYEFCPDNFEKRKIYLQFTYILDIFKKHIQGIVSGNDAFISDLDRELLEIRLKEFYNNEIDINTKSWDYEEARKVTNFKTARNLIIPWNYRGFDRHYLCYYPPLLVRDRFELMQYLLPSQNNLCLIINRQSSGCRGDSSVLVSDTIAEHKCHEGARGLDSYIFPLNIYDSNRSNIVENLEDTNLNLKPFPIVIEDVEGKIEREYNPKKAIHSNIKDTFKKELKFGDNISDRDIFYYIYGVLYTPTYRERYYLGLQEDFPRIPFPDNRQTFLDMSNLGEELIKLHLFKTEEIDSTQFPMSESTDYRVYDVKRNDKDEQGIQISDTYDPLTQKIYFKKRTKSQKQEEKEGSVLNKIMWIGNITQDMWDFEIGGRQQLKMWLYPRRYSEKKRRIESRTK
ncbi:MAG: N-6 DNA methylase [Candidatus Lokiarchaeota archaeon]